jgi:exosortase
MSETSQEPAPPLTFGDILTTFGAWCRNNPAAVFLSAAAIGVCVYFFGFHAVYSNGIHSAWRWMIGSWGYENNQEHSWVVPPIFFFLLWYHREELRRAKIAPSNWSLLIVAAGLLLFVVATRTLQGRLAVISMATLIYGTVRYLWGRQVARVFIFPCLFLLFMLPLGGLVQGTVTLQLMVSSSVKFLSSLIGVKIEMIGTTLKAADGSFNFEIAEGCSGIRSLMAMTMLAALYVHFTQKELWKQLVIFAGSIVFALIGNVGRIFTVILFAKFISPKIAGGIYHDYSGFIFFPFAVATMVSFSQLLNADWKKIGDRWFKPQPVPAVADKATSAPAKSGDPISYDY